MRWFLFLILLIYSLLFLSACNREIVVVVTATPLPATQTPVITVVVTQPPMATPTPIPPTVTPEPPMATATPVFITLQYDMYDMGVDAIVDPIPVSANILPIGTSFLVTVSGTINFCSLEARKSTPEDELHILSPNADAEYFFGTRCGDKPIEELPLNLANFEISTDNQETWFAPIPLEPQYSSSHTYRYLISGEGYPVAFRENDFPTDDNYGVLTIQIEGPLQTIPLPNVTVPANIIWFDPGIEVQAGQRLIFSASGSVNLRNGDPEANTLGPNGRGGPCVSYNYGDCLMNEAPYGTLIGKIGDNAPFIIGANLETSTAASGKLYLSVNDNPPYFIDNIGEYQVTITVNSPN